MKISKWQRYTLCVCAIGGAMIISPVNNVKADDNTVVTTVSQKDKLAVTTQRVLELHSKDGHVNDIQHSKVEWTKQAQDGSYGPTRFSIPKVEGYDTPAKGMAFSLSINEKPDIPLTIYHIDYYPKGERFDRNQAECQVDIKNENDQVMVRHIYNVPYEQAMRVQLTAPENTEFIKATDSQPLITGSYKFNKTVHVRNVNNNRQANVEKTSKDQVSHPANEQVVSQPEAKKATDVGTNTDMIAVTNATTTTDDLSRPVTHDDGVMTDSKPVHLVDTGMTTEQPSVKDEGVETGFLLNHPVTTDSATMTDQQVSVSVINDSTMTDQPISTSVTDGSTMTDQPISPSVIDEGTMTDNDVKQSRTQDETIQTEQENKLTVEKAVGPDTSIASTKDTGVMTDQDYQPTSLIDSITMTDLDAIPVKESSVDQSTQTTNAFRDAAVGTENFNESQKVNEVKILEPVSHQKMDDSLKSGNCTAPEEIDSTTASSKKKGRKATPQELAKLAEYNHPFTSHRQQSAKNEKLPQTGNHVGQLAVACGVALLCVLGLFKTGKKQ